MEDPYFHGLREEYDKKDRLHSGKMGKGNSRDSRPSSRHNRDDDRENERYGNRYSHHYDRDSRRNDSRTGSRGSNNGDRGYGRDRQSHGRDAIEIAEIMAEIVTLEILATENLDAGGKERAVMEGIGTEIEIPDETEIAIRETQDRIATEMMTVGALEAQDRNTIARGIMTMEAIAHRRRHHRHPLTDRAPGQGLARKAQEAKVRIKIRKGLGCLC